jgi:hypothetical protein
MKKINETSFKEFIDKKNEYIRKIEQNRKDRIYAVKNNLPLPELDFEVELWMLS